MRITRHGKPKDPLMQGTCSDCDIDIECLKSETSDLSYRGEMGDCGIRCPECRQWIDTHIKEP